MNVLKEHVYERIKGMSGVSRVQSAFDILKKIYGFRVEKNAYGSTKEVIELSVHGNKFTITKGYSGKFEVGMYSEERKIVGVSTIEPTKEGLIKGEFGIKLKDPTNPQWEKYVESVAANRCFAEFKHISNLCMFVSCVLGVQIFTLSDQASSGCLLSVSTPFNIFISILRLMVGKPSLYESIGFKPINKAKIDDKLSHIREYTYGELIRGKNIDRVIEWAKEIKLTELIQAYLNKRTMPGNTHDDMCEVIQQISNILNRDIYYGDNSKYMRLIADVDIDNMIELLNRCL